MKKIPNSILTLLNDFIMTALGENIFRFRRHHPNEVALGASASYIHIIS